MQWSRTPQRRARFHANSSRSSRNGNCLSPRRSRRFSDRSHQPQRRPRQLRHQPHEEGVLISTTEHLLSAFVGLGVDNAIVEIDNLELPILDGKRSSLCRIDSEGWHPPSSDAPANI